MKKFLLANRETKGRDIYISLPLSFRRFVREDRFPPPIEQTFTLLIIFVEFLGEKGGQEFSNSPISRTEIRSKRSPLPSAGYFTWLKSRRLKKTEKEHRRGETIEDRFRGSIDGTGGH